MGLCPAVQLKQSEDNRSRCFLSFGTGQWMGIPHGCYFAHTRILFTSTPEKMELFFKRRWKMKLKTLPFVLRSLSQFGEMIRGQQSGLLFSVIFYFAKPRKAGTTLHRCCVKMQQELCTDLIYNDPIISQVVGPHWWKIEPALLADLVHFLKSSPGSLRQVLHLVFISRGNQGPISLLLRWTFTSHFWSRVTIWWAEI